MNMIEKNSPLQKSVSGSETSNSDGSTLWEIRTEEQPYAFLSDKKNDQTNRYGQLIDLVDLTGLPENRSMHINENPEVGCNPNRNKQHGFFFTADNCIGCHACEAACSEKNENPAHLAFRSVGYVEGGSYPDYKRMNISMACNHCDDPVCLKGCPTRAYTKHAEYGAVLQDPDTCFGCGYCTWVCPYNAPQLDPVQGQVSKCNMCVDRLEVGLKPACVSACVGNALDFGVIENTPENREQAKISIPGFPDPDITHPNIRFQQTKTLPDEMTRTDSAPVKYHKNEQGNYQPTVDQKNGSTFNAKDRQWNFAKLSSRENPLVLFTLLSQAAIGAFAITFLAAEFGSLFGLNSFVNFRQSAMYAPMALITLLMVAFGLFMSTVHLGKPLRFYRGFNNLRHSPVCREGLGIALFMTTLALHILFSLPANSVLQDIYLSVFGHHLTELITASTAQSIATFFAYSAIPFSLIGLYYMNRCYRIKARPFWNHWQVASSFFGNMLALGAIVSGVIVIPTLLINNSDYHSTLTVLGLLLATGLLLEAIGLLKHHQAMDGASHEGAASHYIQRTTFGRTYLLRNSLLLINLMLTVLMLVSDSASSSALIVYCLVACSTIISCIISRSLFYVLVVPTTMPGAFFWKNKGFEEHARDIGLAKMPQAGIIANSH